MPPRQHPCEAMVFQTPEVSGVPSPVPAGGEGVDVRPDNAARQRIGADRADAGHANDSPAGQRIRRYGDLEVDPDRLRVTVRGCIVPLDGLRLKLLLALLRHPDHVRSRADLLRDVWPAQAGRRDEKAVDVLVCRLRRDLGAAAYFIETVRSFGYRFNPNASPSSETDTTPQ